MKDKEDQFVGLFGEWQTEAAIPFDINKGILPRNQYGNFEICNNEIPEGTFHVDLPGVAKVCMKNSINYVETIVGRIDCEKTYFFLFPQVSREKKAGDIQ